MLTAHNYAIAWGIYLVSALGFYLLLWPLLARIRAVAPRRFLHALALVLLFTPAMTVPEERLMAPATLILAFESAQGDWDMAMQAGSHLVLALVALLVMLALEALFRRMLRPNPKEEG